jgi:hypothetical protein
MMKPYGGEIEAWEVDAAVGQVRNNRPELMYRLSTAVDRRGGTSVPAIRGGLPSPKFSVDAAPGAVRFAILASRFHFCRSAVSATYSALPCAGAPLLSQATVFLRGT